MSRFGDFLSDISSQIKSHEPGWVQDLPSMPGSLQSLQDAMIKNKWNSPFGGDQNSFDIFAGGVGHPAGSEHPWARGVGRTAGTIFGGNALYGLGSSALGGSAGGATEVGAGFPLAEEAGAAGGAGSGGLLSSSGASGGGSGFNWRNLFSSQGGAGNQGIGALMMLLNANQQRRDANTPLMSGADEQNIVQQGTNALARSLSTEGNPGGSGRAQQELQNYATKTLARLRYEQAIRQRAAQSQASNNMFGAGGFGLQALMRILTSGGGGGASSGATTTIPPIGDAVY